MPRTVYLGWFAVRFYRRSWSARPWAHGRAVVGACGWGRWAVQVMRTEDHPALRHRLPRLRRFALPYAHAAHRLQLRRLPYTAYRRVRHL